MIRVLSSAAAGVLLSSAAFAADPVMIEPVPAMAPVPAAINWSGFYVGLNGGYAWGETDWEYQIGGTADHDSDGWLAGGEIGANFQWNWLVIGAEGDLAWANIEGDTACPNPIFSCESEIDLFATARGRLGVAAGRVHVFGTGGWAGGSMEVQTVHTGGAAIPPSGTPTNGSDEWASGWTAGAGAEVMFGNRWTLKADWLYYDLGEDTYTVDNGLLVDAEATGHIARLHVTKLFGGGGQ